MIEHVFTVTLEQLARHGFEGLSVPEVARLAGLNKTSVYRRWATKSDLVQEALRLSMGHRAPPVDSGVLRTDMLNLARGAVDFVESPVGMGVLRTLFGGGASPPVRKLVTSMWRGQDENAPRGVFIRAISRGEIPEEANIELALTTIAGALMHRVFVEQVRVTDASLEALIDLVLFGLAKHEGADRPLKQPQRRKTKGTSTSPAGAPRGFSKKRSTST